jgi:hypothetical protein
MPDFSADDASTIQRNMKRNRLLKLIADAKLDDGVIVSRDMMLAAGYTLEEFQSLPASAHTTPIKEDALR